MNAKTWLNKAISTSVDTFAPVDSPVSAVLRLDAELILAHALQKERTFLHAHPDFEIPENNLKIANRHLERRQKGEPLAYILGEKEFFGRKFFVTPDVLIPRPETEAIIELALSFMRATPLNSQLKSSSSSPSVSSAKPQKILDVGTGSGCIAITLKKELPNISVTGVDISEKALKIAQKNAKNLDAEVNFLQSNLCSALETPKSTLSKEDNTTENPNSAENTKFDLICANLPYVNKKWDWLGAELDFEPEQALYAEDNGLNEIKRLLLQVEQHLSKNGAIILESDLSQHQAIAEFAAQNTSLKLQKTLGYAQLFAR